MHPIRGPFLSHWESETFLPCSREKRTRGKTAPLNMLVRWETAPKPIFWLIHLYSQEMSLSGIKAATGSETDTYILEKNSVISIDDSIPLTLERKKSQSARLQPPWGRHVGFDKVLKTDPCCSNMGDSWYAIRSSKSCVNIASAHSSCYRYLRSFGSTKLPIFTLCKSQTWLSAASTSRRTSCFRPSATFMRRYRQWPFFGISNGNAGFDLVVVNGDDDDDDIDDDVVITLNGYCDSHGTTSFGVTWTPSICTPRLICAISATPTSFLTLTIYSCLKVKGP